MTEELILNLTAQDLATDSVTLYIGYDRSGLDSPRSKAVPASSAIHIDHYGRAVPRPAHGTARLESPLPAPARSFLLSSCSLTGSWIQGFPSAA